MINITSSNIFHVVYMVDNIQQSIHAIGKIYDKSSYFDTYGGSVLLCIVLVIFLALFHLYQKMMLRAEPIRRNWTANRCSPNVIPFAGNIMNPKNMSKIEFTGKNFSSCVSNILEQITGYFVSPIQTILGPIMLLWKSMLAVLQNIRKMIAYIRNQLAKILHDFFVRLMNIIPPMQRMVIAIEDMVAKIQGVFKSGIYMLVGAFYSMMSFFGLLLTFVIIILIALSVLIIITAAVAWFWPFYWAVFASLIVTFLSIQVPLLIMVVFFAMFGVQSPLAVPSTPSRNSCFAPETPIDILGGASVSINSLRPGAVLADGSTVTAFMRVEVGDNKVYNLHGIYVTGDHYVQYNDKWLQVKDHPDALYYSEYNRPYVFCINTSNKLIKVGDCVFSDWDELHEPGMVESHLAHHPTLNNLSKSIDVHRYFEGGVLGETLILCEDGTSKYIDRVAVGEKLAGGVRVTGIVSILGSDLLQVTSHVGSDLGGNPHAILRGGPHNVIINPETRKSVSTLFVKPYAQTVPPASRSKLYHLITDKEYFHLSNGIILRDYTTCIDFFDMNEK